MNHWTYSFDLSGVFQTLDEQGAMQVIVFQGDSVVDYAQVTPGDPIIETEPSRLPPGFGGARGGMVGIRIDSLSVLVTYAANVSYNHPQWTLDARTYYYRYGEAFDIYDLWGMYTNRPPQYRPGIFDPLLWEKLETTGDAPPGSFLFSCELDPYLIQGLQ